MQSRRGGPTRNQTSVINVINYFWWFVALPVWIDVPPKNTDAIVNETVELQCQGRGSPTPTITWLKNDQNINFANNLRFFQKNTGSLLISRSQESDSGKYTCVATNSLGSKRANATLRVLRFHVKICKPIIP